jgi:Aspartyl/asparaginyl beta-hydroxylase and related dioxygenases
MYMFYDLTDRFPVKLDLEKMRAELASLEGGHWLSHYDKALAEGWTTIPLASHDGSSDNEESQRVGQWGKYKTTPYADQLPYMKSVLNAFQCPFGRVRIMKLMPGSIIREHRDTYEEVSDYAFGQVRLHIPIVTNDKVVFSVDGKPIHMKAGRLYYVNFSKKHFVRNDGDAARTHLVLDLKVNDALRKVFPPITRWQRIEMALARTFIPIFLWVPLRLHRESKTAFWRMYNGSALQRLKHKLLPKHQPG